MPQTFGLPPARLKWRMLHRFRPQAVFTTGTSPLRRLFSNLTGSASCGLHPVPIASVWNQLCLNPTQSLDWLVESQKQSVSSSSDIGASNCSVFCNAAVRNYMGETSAGGCPSDYKGAVGITNRIVLHEAGMNTWDRGFDATGNQVWGAKISLSISSD